MSPPDADADGAQAPPSASAEEMRKLLKPNPSEGEVLAALSRTYPTMNLNIVRELESYDDKNYLVQDAANDGTKYLAKIHNGVESLDYINKISSPNCRTSVIDLQNAIFSHLDAVNGVTTSVSVPPTVAEDGAVVSLHDLPVMSSAHSPSKLVVRLLTWVPGVPLSSVPSLPSRPNRWPMLVPTSADCAVPSMTLPKPTPMLSRPRNAIMSGMDATH